MASRRLALPFISLLLVLPLWAQCDLGRLDADPVVNVDTAVDLQAALANGSRHIRITDHINATGTEPQIKWRDGSRCMYHVFEPTVSITGACWARPAMDLALDWVPGTCVLHVPDHDGFSIVRDVGVFWMHNVYVVLTGPAPQSRRIGVSISGRGLPTNDVYAYLTNTTIELRPQSTGNASVLNPLLVGASYDGPAVHVLAAALNVITIYAAERLQAVPTAFTYEYEVPNPDSTLSLVDSTFANVNAEIPALIYFDVDLRVERCTFKSTPEPRANLFFRNDYSAARLYMDDNVTYHESALSDYPLTLLMLDDAQHDARESRALRPFLTLQDYALQSIQAEVLGTTPPPKTLPSTLLQPTTLRSSGMAPTKMIRSRPAALVRPILFAFLPQTTPASSEDFLPARDSQAEVGSVQPSSHAPPACLWVALSATVIWSGLIVLLHYRTR